MYNVALVGAGQKLALLLSGTANCENNVLLQFVWPYVQESATANGNRETNSELSRVLDVLDEAAGDSLTVSTHLTEIPNGRE